MLCGAALLLNGTKLKPGPHLNGAGVRRSIIWRYGVWRATAAIRQGGARRGGAPGERGRWQSERSSLAWPSRGVAGRPAGPRLPAHRACARCLPLSASAWPVPSWPVAGSRSALAPSRPRRQGGSRPPRKVSASALQAVEADIPSWGWAGQCRLFTVRHYVVKLRVEVFSGSAVT